MQAMMLKHDTNLFIFKSQTIPLAIKTSHNDNFKHKQ